MYMYMIPYICNSGDELCVRYKINEKLFTFGITVNHEIFKNGII